MAQWCLLCVKMTIKFFYKKHSFFFKKGNVKREKINWN
jgi:hypothetical protein